MSCTYVYIWGRIKTNHFSVNSLLIETPTEKEKKIKESVYKILFGDQAANCSSGKKTGELLFGFTVNRDWKAVTQTFTSSLSNISLLLEK